MTLIYNYGLFWKEEDVFWGKPDLPGGLYGLNSTFKKDERVEFTDQIGLYVLYADYDPIYAGQVRRGETGLFARLGSHRSDVLAGQWNRFSWFGCRPVLDNGALAKAEQAEPAHTAAMLDCVEAILIAAVEPPFNRKGWQFGECVDMYLQYRDEKNLGPKDEGPIGSVWDWTEELN